MHEAISMGIKMASEKKSEATRQRIHAVTAELFHRKGYLSTSMRDIAAAAGMKSGSLYYYYESKEALLAAILNEGIDETIAALKAALAELPHGSSVRSRFKAAMVTAMRRIANSGDMAVASSRTLELLREADYAEQARHRQAYNRFWRDLLDEGKKRGEIRSSLSDVFASMWAIGAMSFLTEWYDPNRSSIDEVAEEFVKLLFDGITARKRQAGAASKTS